MRAISTKAAIGAALLATTALGGLAPALAQEPAGGLEEIVVTAQRREQSLQDVPVAVTAFSAADLERSAAPDIVYIAQSVPNLTLKRSRATNSTLTAFIRGVGQQDPVAGFEQGVGIYVDDVYFNRPQGAVLDVFDVERIEVLRGPQGTLYGRNTIGGAVKYVTKRLADEPHFELKGALGTYTQTDIVAKASAPVGENLRLGVGGARFKRDGFGENLTTGQDNYNKDEWAARATAEIDASDNLFVRLTGDYFEDDSAPRQGHRLIAARLTPGFPVLSDVYDTRAGIVGPPAVELVNTGMSFLLQLQASDNWTLKNIFAYRHSRSGQQIDFDSLPAIDIDVPVLNRDHQTSEEIQAAYDGDAIQAILGFYYLSASAYNEFDVLLARTGQLVNLPGLNAYTYGKVGTDTWSVYGDATFDLEKIAGWNGLELSLGGRFTSDERNGRVIRRTLLGGRSAKFGNTGTVIATTSDFTGNAKFHDFTPRAVLTYKPDADNTLYASFSQGFKGGGFDPRGQTTAAPDLNNDGVRSAAEIFDFMEFLPESITTYELGWKAIAMDGRLRSNADVFYSDYKNVQIPGSIGVDTNGDGVADNFSGVTTNAGKARFYGAEWEGNVLLAEDAATSGDSLKANWSVGWIDAKYTEFFAAVASGGRTTLQNVASQRVVQNTPKWTVSLGFNYTTPLSAFGRAGEIAFIPSVSYRSAHSQFEYRSPIDQAKYALVDASIVWTADNSGLQLGLHGKNLTDKKYKVAGYDFVTATTLGVEGTLTAFYGDPLTVTATVGLKF